MHTHRTRIRSGRGRTLAAVGSAMLITVAGIIGVSLASPAAATSEESQYTADISCTDWSVNINAPGRDRDLPWSATLNGATVASGTLANNGDASASGTYTATGGENTLRLSVNGTERASDSAECDYTGTFTTQAIEVCQGASPSGVLQIVGPITRTATSSVSQSAADDAAEAAALAEQTSQLVALEPYSLGACPSVVTPVPSGGGAAKVFTATASASGGVDLCLVDGVTTIAITYDVTQTGSGPTTGDAEYSANVATVAAVNASIAAQTPTGATLGACGAPIATAPITVNPVLPATTPQNVAVPAAAKVPTSVPAGDGSEAPGAPLWVLAAALIAMVGGGAAGVWLVSGKE
ncbi:MAG TPA: hypothetical protein DCQ36_13280 [Actinobacteria bacterium]|nr:hypothetical protein [Actinomycetota bacterium]